MKIIYTIGHSTRSPEEFIALLEAYGIETLADVRSFPGSRKFPWFNKENLEKLLPASGIQYIHLRELGGRRSVKKNSSNTSWRNPAFQGYADYMETPEFLKGIELLMALTEHSLVCYMCSEAVWWRCHRSMISDYLKSTGWTVMHIMDKKHLEEHPYTQPARIVNGKLTYSEKKQAKLTLFDD